ncbi:reverse transcriptase family protein [Salibacterium halotolerans]|uniref:Reverse transcriptase (RNA-dependent DNA polymerase) n=1 Tax=Salibacterium halotolerans TaxID=1884432 RepID=A0A1I5SFL8_9BACI|nr:reverse transcriptase family protein [Salibacterium halotolerans]SFP69511.1 Reverse transcriptase (RNA-dependent DNA polymerase) [Salibacterium halotolerans]
MLVPPNHYLYKLQKRKRLGKILHVQEEKFRRIEEWALVHPFNKKQGEKTRRLFNTEKEYKVLLRRLNRMFLQLNIPEYVYAGIPNLDFLSNANSHFTNSYLQSVDIKSFFPNTHESYVYGLFLHKFKMSKDVAKILTTLTTYTEDIGSFNRHLPQGFPTSTILSFLAYFDMFNGISKLSKERNIHFSLFVDDMTFSSQERIPKSFLNQVQRIVNSYGLQLHPDKFSLYYPSDPKPVTGVVYKPNENILSILDPRFQTRKKDVLRCGYET